jgi:uncharacterized RDD family membrane protein YckC
MSSMAVEELASVRERFFAVVIDILLIAPISVIFIRFTGQTGILLSILVGLLYHSYCWTHFTGQTFGKKIINIRVVKADGSEVNNGDAIVRYFACLVSVAMLGFGWLMLRSDVQRQGWHDKIAGTIVIKNY